MLALIALLLAAPALHVGVLTVYCFFFFSFYLLRTVLIIHSPQQELDVALQCLQSTDDR
jgi:hypothetical protein